jgi:hypothetical protein
VEEGEINGWRERMSGCILPPGRLTIIIFNFKEKAVDSPGCLLRSEWNTGNACSS